MEVQDIDSVQNAIKCMQRTLMKPTQDRVTLEIRRYVLLEDALREAKKQKFDVHKFVKVCKLVMFIIANKAWV